MLEIKVNIEAQDLSQAITQLALAIKGDVVAVPGQPELVIPAGTPMAVTAVKEVPQEMAPAPAEVPQNTAPASAQVPVDAAPAQTAQAPIQQPPMNPPTAPALDLDTISRAGAALVDQGKMQEILAILQKYGVLAVNQLRPDQYPAFAEDLRALGAAI